MSAEACDLRREQAQTQAERWRVAGLLLAILLLEIFGSSLLPRKVTTSRQTRERIEVIEENQAILETQLLQNQERILECLENQK